jgi:hypothetical protein
MHINGLSLICPLHRGPYEQNTEFEEADLYTDIFPHAVSISNRAVKMSLEELKGELDLS